MEPTIEQRRAYYDAREWLTLAVHSLPVHDQVHPSGAAGFAVMADGLTEFEQLCAELGLDDHREFIEDCRWHFDHYPHYLSRHRHFANYAEYIDGRRGPRLVKSPPKPPGCLKPAPPW